MSFGVLEEYLIPPGDDELPGALRELYDEERWMLLATESSLAGTYYKEQIHPEEPGSGLTDFENRGYLRLGLKRFGLLRDSRHAILLPPARETIPQLRAARRCQTRRNTGKTRLR